MSKALARGSVIIELNEDVEQYEAFVVSTNGVILQPYDTSTTLIGSVLKNKVDITNKINDIRWTKWNPTEDNLEECPEWNKVHKGSNIISITKDDVDGKSIFTFEAYNSIGELLCSSSISIVDVNDLLISTNKPNDPYKGQIWIDDSTEPATIYVWNGEKWIVTGSIGAIVKNLLRNTSFTYNAEHWEIVGDTKQSYTPIGVDYLGRRFLKLASEVVTDQPRGVTQTTIDAINKNSEYSFQMLFYSKTNTETYSNNIYVNIYSVDTGGQEDIIYENVIEADNDLKKLFAKFATLPDTDKIRVELLGESNFRYEFYVGELALYNTHNDYPWTVNPVDMVLGSTLTREDIWNILSNNGTVQGIFTRINPETGQLDYYINADMIAAGLIKAEFIEMYGLKVFRKVDGEFTEDVTFEVTDDGQIIMNPKSIVIDTQGSTLYDTIQTVTPEGITTTVSTILKDENNEVTKQVQSIFKQSSEEISAKVEDLIEDTDALVELTSKGVFIDIRDGNNHTLVDADGNSISIDTGNFNVNADNIKLEGYTTINEGFAVDLEGNMHAKNGTFEGDISASTITGSEMITSTLRGGKIVAPLIVSDETETPKFKLSEEGALIAREVEIKGQIAGTIMVGDTFMTSNRKFAVLANGTLEAEDANIKGVITAGSRVESAEIIGGTVIGTTIKNNSGSFSVSPEGVVTGASIRGGTIGIGGADYDAFTVDNNGNVNITKGKLNIANNFIVNNDGSFTAKSASITGNINSGSTITGAKIIGTEIQNALTNPTFSISKDGKITGGSIQIGDNFTVSNSGILTAKQASFSGTVSGSKITGSTVIGTAIQNSETAPTFKIDSAGNIKGGSINIGNGNFYVSPEGVLTAREGSFHGSIDVNNGTFKVDPDGTVTAKKGVFEVSIKSTEGMIAGYEIKGDDLIGSNVGMSGKSGTNYAFWAGSNTSSSAPFRVGHNGTLTATNANIQGKITSSSMESTNITGGKIISTTMESTNIIGGKITGTELIGTTIHNQSNTFSITQDGKITGASLTTGNGSFFVSTDGNLEVGGAALQTIDSYGRSPLEITPSGVLYSVSSTAGTYTKVSAGKIECKGANGATIIDNGSINAEHGSFNGVINGSEISASTFSSNEGLFEVSDSGEVSAVSITSTNIDTASIHADELNVPWTDGAFTRNYTCYINKDYEYPDPDDTTEIIDTGRYASLSDLIDLMPRNLNGYTLKIYLENDFEDNLEIYYFHSGTINIYEQSHSINGYVKISGNTVTCNIYGGTSSDESSGRGMIIPNTGYKYSENACTLYADIYKLTVYNVDIYKCKTMPTGCTTTKGIVATNGTIGYLSAIKAVNQPTSLLRTHSCSRVYVAKSSGSCSGPAFQAVSGSEIRLNTTTQAGTSSSSNYYTSGNASIYSTGVTPDNVKVTVTNPTTSTSTTVTKSKTVKSTTGRSWRTSGSYASSWSSDVTVRQGRWTTSLGINQGYWFFGNEIYNILHDNSNTVTSLKIKITRNAGGASAAHVHHLRMHKLATKPSGSPTGSLIGTSYLNKTFSVAVGSSVTVSLSATEIANFKSQSAKGFALVATDNDTGTAGEYSCCSASCTVTMTYKTTS